MERSNLVKTIESLLNDSYFHGEWRLIWNEEKRTIEVILQQKLENPLHQSIYEDWDQVSITEDFIYEVRVLFYSTQNTVISADDFLVHISVDEKMGIMHGDVLAIFTYLNRIVAKIPLQWREFLAGSEDTFEMVWLEEELAGIRQSLMDHRRFASSLLFLPLEK